MFTNEVRIAQRSTQTLTNDMGTAIAWNGAVCRSSDENVVKVIQADGYVAVSNTLYDGSAQVDVSVPGTNYHFIVRSLTISLEKTALSASATDPNNKSNATIRITSHVLHGVNTVLTNRILFLSSVCASHDLQQTTIPWELPSPRPRVVSLWITDHADAGDGKTHLQFEPTFDKPVESLSDWAQEANDLGRFVVACGQTPAEIEAGVSEQSGMTLASLRKGNASFPQSDRRVWLTVKAPSDDSCGKIVIRNRETAVYVDATGFDTTPEGTPSSTTYVPGDYRIIDLTTGASTIMENMTDPSIFSADEYKTEKMVFRYVPDGKFKSYTSATNGLNRLLHNDVAVDLLIRCSDDRSPQRSPNTQVSSFCQMSHRPFKASIPDFETLSKAKRSSRSALIFRLVIQTR